MIKSILFTLAAFLIFISVLFVLNYSKPVVKTAAPVPLVTIPEKVVQKIPDSNINKKASGVQKIVIAPGKKNQTVGYKYNPKHKGIFAGKDNGIEIVSFMASESKIPLNKSVMLEVQARTTGTGNLRYEWYSSPNAVVTINTGDGEMVMTSDYLVPFTALNKYNEVSTIPYKTYFIPATSGIYKIFCKVINEKQEVRTKQKEIVVFN